MSIFKRTQRKYVKKAYRVRNWREYEAGLRNRGSLTVWISLTAGKLVNWDAPRYGQEFLGLSTPAAISLRDRRRHFVLETSLWSRPMHMALIAFF